VALLDHKYYTAGMWLTYGFAFLVALGTPILTAYMKIPSCGQYISIYSGKESSVPSKESSPPLFEGLLYSSTSKVLFVAEEPDSSAQSVFGPPQSNANILPTVSPTEQQPLKFQAIFLDDVHQIRFHNTRFSAQPGNDLLCVVFQ
jgi:hypothetical protein